MVAAAISLVRPEMSGRSPPARAAAAAVVVFSESGARELGSKSFQIFLDAILATTETKMETVAKPVAAWRKARKCAQPEASQPVR